MKQLKVSIIFLALFTVQHAMAAPAPPAGGGNPTCWPPPCVPIDGGISLLMAAGALYGAKKIYKTRKTAQD